MNQAYDYNGHVVAPSKPTKVLRTVKKTIHIDSADRDKIKFVTNGDWVAYLPRVYKNVVSITLTQGMFPAMQPSGGTPGALTHSYNSTGYSSDAALTRIEGSYFLLDLVGLNKSDECAIEANKSGYTDSFFGKINSNVSSYLAPGLVETGRIVYSNKSDADIISRFSPPIENLDRLQIRTRLHSQQGNKGFIYWTVDGSPTGSRNGSSEYNLTLEIEYLENGFDDFSSFETRLGCRN